MITNNDFASWVVKGYIAKEKNHDVNWAIDVVYMAKEKARKVEVVALKSKDTEMNAPHTT
jgi:hypothetical protein